MSVTSTNYYTSSGVDLINVFNAYTSGTQAELTGYKVNGTDLRDIFQAYSSGTTANTTGISVDGVDLSNIFEQISEYTISGGVDYITYSNSGYTVIVFTIAISGSTISFSTNKTVNCIVVGPGGNGGNGNSANGGGGGGGGGVNVNSLSVTKNTSYSILVGTTSNRLSSYFHTITAGAGNNGTSAAGGGAGGSASSGGGAGGQGGKQTPATLPVAGSNGTQLNVPITVTINSTNYTYLGGGGAGGKYFNSGTIAPSAGASGGLSGGGNSGKSATASTGGGGGGGLDATDGRNGASGVVILYFT